MLCRKTEGLARAAGAAAAMAAAAVTADVATKGHAARLPSRAAIITAITGRAGHAVIFMAHAIPVARAVPVDRDGRIRCGLTSQRSPAARGAAPVAAGPAPRHARATQNSASTGGSVIPTGQRGRQGAGRADQQRRVPPARAAVRHRGDRGQQVATRCPDPPGLVRVPAEHRQQRGVASEHRVPRRDPPPVKPGLRIKPRLARLRRVQAG